MKILRPVRADDLEPIYELSAQTKVGLTTLPHDRTFLQQRIEASVQNFAHPPQKPGGEVFMFVLEDTAKQVILGTSALYTKVGGFEPFWTYEIKSKKHCSEQLGVDQDVAYLKIKKIHNGPSEIGTLFLAPEARCSYHGRMLSLGRFLFMAEHAQYFEEDVLAELRGVIDERGKSVFWEALGAHFFKVPLAKADGMVNQDKSFIADLMPQHPIYLPLLPEKAQAVIGRVHPETLPARKLLEQEGFRFQNEIDIFEAGPVLGAKVSELRTVRESRCATLAASEKPMGEKKRPLFLIANCRAPADFRLAVGPVEVKTDELAVTTPEVAQALNLKEGDSLCYAPIKNSQ